MIIHASDNGEQGDETKTFIGMACLREFAPIKIDSIKAAIFRRPCELFENRREYLVAV